MMGNYLNFPVFSLLFFHFFTFLSCSSFFILTDNYLINCGSASPSITTFDNRKFSGDESSLSNSIRLSSTQKIPLTDSVRDSTLYNSLRIFKKASKYMFLIKEKGAHLVRLHFHRFKSPKFDLVDAQFHGLANGYLLLNDFSGLIIKNVEIKEYILWVDSHKLEIMFTPSRKSKFGFISAIEVVSAPKDLISDVAHFVNSDRIAKIDGILDNALETMYRVNVGGPKVIPFNDSMWRSWENDKGFLELDKDSWGGRLAT